jgi:hypothetical protein
MERAIQLWDRPRFRRTFIVVAAVVLVAGLAVRYQTLNHGQTVYHTPGPNPFTASEADYGKVIPLPAEAQRTAKQFITMAVLRRDTAASYDLVTPKFRTGYTRAAWAKGAIPVQPFPSSAFGGATDRTVRSRASSVLFLVAIGSTTPTVPAGEFFLELVPVDGRWLVNYWAPKGTQPPVPSNQ